MKKRQERNEGNSRETNKKIRAEKKIIIDGLKHISPIPLNFFEKIAGVVIAEFIRLLEKKRQVELIGEEHLAEVQEVLNRHGVVVLYFIPHTDTFDPLVINAHLIFPKILGRVRGAGKKVEFIWPAASKFAFLVKGMEPFERKTQLALYGFRDDFRPVYLIQEYIKTKIKKKLTDEGEDAELIEKIIREVKKFNLRSGKILRDLIRENDYLVQALLIALSPEATRNESGELLEGQPGIWELIIHNALKAQAKNDNHPPILIQPVVILGSEKLGDGDLLHPAPVTLEIVKPLTPDEMLKLATQLTWINPPKGKTAGEHLSPADALMWYAAQQLPEGGAIGRGPYASDKVKYSPTEA